MEGIYEVLKYLPRRLVTEIISLDGESLSRICEIRLRTGLPMSLSGYDENIFFPQSAALGSVQNAFCVSEEEIVQVIKSLCQCSVYNCTENLRQGFIVTGDGIRVGIAGQCIYRENKIFSVKNYTSVNIRIPHFIKGCSRPIYEKIKSCGIASTLIFSPPGAGKTTILRDLAAFLASGEPDFGALRTAVIDEREELFPSETIRTGLMDVFRGYKKSDGIEIAARLFSPQVIICDEIGRSDDVESIMNCESGVPFIVTTHGSCIEELKRRPQMARLIDSGLFSRFVKLEKGKGRIKILNGEGND